MKWLMCNPPKPARRAAPPRRFLVVSLLTKNHTSAAEQGGGTVEVEPAAGVTTRPHKRRRLAASPDLPEEILVWEIFVRLPAKDVLRCRAVCRSWRSLTSPADFLLAHHRRQPSLPLLTLCDPTSTKPIFEGGRRPVLGFDDYQGFELHASCDGLLLLALSNGRFSICNPATRQCSTLPDLTANGRMARIGIKALYRHCPSREYRVLYLKRSYAKMHLDAAYYILALPLGSSSRCIQITSDSPDVERVILAPHRMTRSNWAPPVVFHNNLHWDLDFLQEDTGIVVFDTEVESFRSMCRPAAATRFCTRLCDMDGLIGFSCFHNDKTVAKIWVLEDYEKEVWSFKYHVKFSVESLCNLEDTQHLVLSPKGDVLVYSNLNFTCFTVTTPASCSSNSDGYHWIRACLAIGSKKASSNMTSSPSMAMLVLDKQIFFVSSKAMADQYLFIKSIRIQWED